MVSLLLSDEIRFIRLKFKTFLSVSHTVTNLIYNKVLREYFMINIFYARPSFGKFSDEMCSGF